MDNKVLSQYHNDETKNIKLPNINLHEGKTSCLEIQQYLEVI